MKLYGAFLLLLLTGTPHVLGCPICDSETGQTVRAGIFNSSFPITFIEVIAPFLILAPLLYLINRHLPD